MKKRILSLMLVAAMLAGLMPTVAFAGNSESTERPEDYVLTYNTTVGAMSERIPAVNSSDAAVGATDEIWLHTNGTNKVLYNLDLMNWKKTLTDDDGEYKTLDTTKTAEFAIETGGYDAGFVVGDTSTQVNATSLDITPLIANYGAASTTRPHLALRLNIPYAGAYKLAFTDNTASAAYKPYTKIWFGAAPAAYSAAELDGLLKNYTHIGWWSSVDGHFSSSLTADTKADCKVDYLTLDVPVAGEYYLVFDFPAESKTLNTSSLSDKGKNQYFRLSGFTLTATDEELVRPEGYSATYELKSTSVSDKVPQSTTDNGKGESSRVVYYDKNGKAIVYNQRLLDWNYTMTTDEDGTFNTLDLSKTAPYKIELSGNLPAGMTNGNTTMLSACFLSKTAAYTNTSATRPHVVIRLYIPYSGRYSIDFASTEAVVAYRPYTKVYFGEAQSEYDASAIDNLIANSYEYLGWYNAVDGQFSTELTVDTKEDCKVDKFYIDVPEAGEYYLVFDHCAESLTYNAELLSSTYQYFSLGTINLVGIDTPTAASVETDARKSVMIDKEYDFTAKIKMTNDEYAVFSDKNTITVAGSANLAVSDVAASGDTVSFKVKGTALSAEEILTFSGNISGKAFSFEKAVIVAENEITDQIFDFTQYNPTNSTMAMYSFDYDEHGWEVNIPGTSTYLQSSLWNTKGIYALGIYGYTRLEYLQWRPMSIDFKVDYDGYYAISMLLGLNHKANGYGSAYIDGKYIGQLTPNTTANVLYNLRPLELKAGKHTLTVIADRAGKTANQAYVNIAKLNFKGIAQKPELSEAKLTLPAGTLYAGGTITASAGLLFNDGTEIVALTESYLDDLSDDTYNYNSYKTADGESMAITSNNAAVAEVSGTEIKLVAPGSADITFTATLDGVTKSVTKTITVEQPVLESIDVKAETSYVLLDDADGVALTVTGKLSDGSDADLSGATITYESSDKNVAMVENGCVMPKSLGEVTITAIVNDGDIEIEKSIDLIVSEVPIAPSFQIRFKDENSQATSTNGYYDADTCGNNWTINKNITSSAYYNASSTAGRIQASVEYLYLYPHGDFAVDFETSMDGYYDITLDVIRWKTTTGPVNYYIDGKYVGSVDPYDSVGDLYTTYVTLGRPVELSAGKHTLVIRKPGYLFAIGATFTGTAEPTGFKGIEIGVSRNEYAAGESGDYTTALVWENGARLNVPVTNLDGSVEALFEVTSSDDSTISVSGNTFKALKTGRANLQASAEYEGQQISGVVGITVNDAVYDYAELNLDEELLYFVGGSKQLKTTVVLSNGKTTEDRNVSNIRYESSNENIAKVENGVLQNIAEGEVTITAYATFNGEEKSVSKTIKVENVKLVGIRAESEDNVISALDSDGSGVVVYGVNNDGSEVDLSGAVHTVETLTPEIITVDEDGMLHYVSRGIGKIHVTSDVNGEIFECDAEIVSSSQKTEPTIYTYEMREQALKNVTKYDWAKSLQKSAVNNSQKYLDNLEKYYDLIPAEGIPRSYTITTLQSPADMTYICPYCRSDIRALHGAYSWVINPITDPWKIACPECKRKFPSNDFESFYKLGLKGDGTFDRELAYQRNQELVDAGETGYLVNELYPDVWKDSNLNVSQEMASTWMVDDGFGWSPKSGTYGGSESVTTDPKWAPIAYYTHVFWDRNGSTYSVISRAMNDLREAYLYTGEAKYGRAGAILLDRIADVYDDYDVSKISMSYSHSHGGDYSGKTVGSIWETNVANTLVRAYDAFYPMMDDPQVVSFLAEKAVQYGNPNPKTNADMIRENAENGILRSVIDGVKTAKINGNFGMHQLSIALAAVALDTYPETGEAFDWMALPGGETKKSITDPIYGTKYNSSVKNAGGEMLTRYINEVCRDGFGNEVGIGYNMLWINNGIEIAELLSRYGAETKINLFENPKYLKMFNSFIKLNVGQGYGISIGDSGGTATNSRTSIESHTLRAFNMLGDPQYAKNYYWAMDGDLDDIYIDIFTDNESLAKNIEKIVDEQGEYEFESEMLTGYGFSVLRYGELIPGANGGSDTRGDAWMYHGRIGGHGHNDGLQLGINAYGFNFTPDLGYPEATGYDPNRLQWCSQTISHNTVVVNGESHISTVGGTPLHFDNAGKVQIMDVDLESAYSAADVYRRTVVSVQASNDVSYTVDFFRILGGDEHMYSFHTQSYMGYSTDDLTLVPQVDDDGNYVGTYAGADVPYGPDPNTILTSGSYKLEYTRGYTWLDNVNRAENIEDGNFSVNFKQTDFRGTVNSASGLNLKYTALNDWTPSQIGIATGYAPNTATNKMIPGLDYMLIHRKGKNLDTLFTSVLQPYNGEEYIESMESVTAEVKEGRKAKEDVVKAIKVVLKNGRTDYIIYSTNNNVLYTIDGKFDFRGVIGVYSLNEAGENIYAYINDGDVIGETTSLAALTGTVADYTAELSKENSITIALDDDYEFDMSELAGKYIYVDNTHSNQNGAYRILGAEMSGENIVLDLGDVSLVKSYKNNSNPDEGYIFNVAKEQTVVIPMSTVLDDAPIFDAVDDDLITSAGSTIKVSLNATSPIEGNTVTYKATTLPRGAVLDEQTGTVTWKPSSSQLGESGFVVMAVDEDGRESSVTFTVTVYGATTGGTGGGGGSGTSSPSTTPDSGSDDDDDSSSTTTPGEGSTTTPEDGNGADAENVRFIDLGNHVWAADSINSLADDGIVKGTTPNTYSPANNITRADFALLLVRAFELESDNAENFDDVSDSDYFAAELAIARNTGIVNGIGDNKYAPRNTITRQDMMLILYRALVNLGVEFEAAEIDYPDVADISDYAEEAVKALVSAGLVNGKSGRLAPKDYTTRAEVAVLLKRILDYTTK